MSSPLPDLPDLPDLGLVSLLGLTIGSLLAFAIPRVARQPRKALRGLRIPLVGLGTAALFAAITLRFGVHPGLAAYLYLGSIGVALALLDYDKRRLPDTIVLPSYVIAVLLLMPAGAQTGDWMIAVRAFGGMIALGAIYSALALAYPRGLDLGDVKVAGLLGLYLGWTSWSAVLVGAIGGLVIGAFGGVSLPLGRPAKDGSTIAFTQSLVAAAVLALFITVPLTSWYSVLLGST
jgi:leader peptidase (prepilin peptidase)/N-methyltransferase